MNIYSFGRHAVFLGRLALTLVLGLVLILPLAPKRVSAQEVVRVVVPAPPGGSLDLTARGLAERLHVATGKPHLVENRPGAGTMIGTEYVARAAPTGTTLLFTGTTLVIQPSMHQLAFSPVNDLVPVVQVATSRFVLVAQPSLGATTAADLHRLAVQQPQGLNCGAPPGPMALACEQLRARFGGKVTPIPFPGIAPAVASLLGGHVDFAFINVEAVEQHLEAGRLRLLGASYAAGRSDVPRFSQVWPGFVLEGFSGVFAPAGTPRARVRQLNLQINQLLVEPQFAAFMRESGQDPAGGTPEQFAAQVRKSHRQYADLIRKLDLAPR